MLSFYAAICMKICPLGQDLLQVRKVSNSQPQTQELKSPDIHKTKQNKKTHPNLQPERFWALERPHCAWPLQHRRRSVAMAAVAQLCGLVSITSSCSLQKKQDDSSVLNERFFSEFRPDLNIVFSLNFLLFIYFQMSTFLELSFSFLLQLAGLLTSLSFSRKCVFFFNSS